MKRLYCAGLGLAVASLFANTSCRHETTQRDSPVVEQPTYSEDTPPYMRYGTPAPDFTATTLDGKTISLHDLEGKVVLLAFFATWCRPCKENMPYVKELHEEYADRSDFALIGVSLDTDKQELQKYVASEGLQFPILFEGVDWENNQLAKLYQVWGIPEMVFIDKQRNFAGSQDLDLLLENK